MLAADTPDVSRHKCLIYDGEPSEQLPVIVPLLLDALRKNERCLYIGSPSMVAMIEAALAASGVDVARECSRGALIFSSERTQGAFDPQQMVALLEQLIDGALREGFTGLCATGDMRWELGDDDANFERLLEYEALLEQVFPRKPLRGICQYHRSTVPRKAVQDALLAHRSLYVGTMLNRDNLYYVPPELLLADRGHGDQLGAWMCQQLTRLMDAERKRDLALQQLAESNHQLERRVEERTEALAAANRELEAFSYSVSHDLRAPVRHISGFARVLEDEFGGRLGGEGLEYVRKLRDAGQRMSALIDGMLALARAARREIRLGRVDLTALAEAVASDLRRGEPSRSVRFAIEPGLSARADATLLHAVLENLLGNAWKFTAKTADARIEVRAVEQTNGFQAFCVADNGAGFDMAHAQKLFLPFERLHPEEEFRGSGVGLATVARIIQRHGGRVWAEGTPGRGARFYFTLPSAVPQDQS